MIQFPNVMHLCSYLHVIFGKDSNFLRNRLAPR